jgi:Domain of unknown function (DUF6754)
MSFLLSLCYFFNLLAPPTNVIARDNPNDEGGKILVTWTLSADDQQLDGYEIYRKAETDTAFTDLAFRGKSVATYLDEEAKDGTRYYYKISAIMGNETAESEISHTAVSSPQWFDTSKTGVVVFAALFIFLIVFFISRAKKGLNLFIRKIAGLAAVDEAVGRATEMGKPILFVPGLSTMDDVATIAALNILGEISKTTAKYSTNLIVPVADPIVYTVAREVVKESYTEAGRPDAFNPDCVYFLTDDQFAFAAAVDGIMTRERPATNFLIGFFWAESLILAETGAATGAIQIAGTDAVTQLPFFISACDYTLIGEELYAASAYLSHEPLLLGALKGQDYGKLIILGVLLAASLAALLAGLPVLKLF